jgi:hypothetical protein
MNILFDVSIDSAAALWCLEACASLPAYRCCNRCGITIIRAGSALDYPGSVPCSDGAGFFSDRTNVEVFGDYVLSQRSSVEIFAGEDISGDTDARVLGISFNLLFNR